MKSTYGVVSRSGLIALASSLDQIGPLAKTSEDAKMIFDFIAGYDEMDSTSVSLESKLKEFKNLTFSQPRKIGVPRDFLKKGVDPEILQNFEENLGKLEKAGYKIVDIELPYSEYSLAVYYIIMPAEVSTNLSRLDGMRYGLRKEGKDVFDSFKKSRSLGFGLETRRRIIL